MGLFVGLFVWLICDKFILDVSNLRDLELPILQARTPEYSLNIGTTQFTPLAITIHYNHRIVAMNANDRVKMGCFAFVRM